MKRALLWHSLAVLVLVGAGCVNSCHVVFEDSVGLPCESSANCPAGLVCGPDGTCVQGDAGVAGDAASTDATTGTDATGTDATTSTDATGTDATTSTDATGTDATGTDATTSTDATGTDATTSTDATGADSTTGTDVANTDAATGADSVTGVDTATGADATTGTDAATGSDATTATDAGTGGDSAVASYTVGGTISNLTGTGLRLLNNGGDSLDVTAGRTTFTFATAVLDGSAYNVSVGVQPTNPPQTCIVSSAQGTVNGANVTSVSLNCTTGTSSVGGSVSGLTGTGLVLQNNDTDDLAILGNGPFTFETPAVIGSSYDVTVFSQPGSPNQNCTVSAGFGSVGSAPVTSVVVTCVTVQYTIGGEVTGLAGSGLVLRNNGGDNKTVVGIGTVSFTFATPIADGSSYAVTVFTNPTSPRQTCTLTGTTGSGMVNGANVTSVRITCTTNTFALRVSISGLAGNGLILTNGSDSLSPTANTTYTFATPIPDQGSYNIGVAQQPTNLSQSCTMSSPSGTVDGAAVTVPVTCVTSTFTVGGQVTGLAGGTVVLRNNNTNNTSVTGAGTQSFTFSVRITDGQSYSVSVFTQPTAPDQRCDVTANGNGTLAGANVTGVQVTCRTYRTISGTISDLRGAGLELRNNNVDPIFPALGATAFSFPTRLLDGDAYSVNIAAPPQDLSQTCTVNNASGTVSGSMTQPAVSCTTNRYTISVDVYGMAGGTLVLKEQITSNNLVVSADGSVPFAMTIEDGQRYDVIVTSNPANRVCRVYGGAGKIHGANVTGINATCAKPFLVNMTTDELDWNPGDGICETAIASMDCPLRGAVMESMADGVPNIIFLQTAGTYTLTRAPASDPTEDDIAVGDLDIFMNAPAGAVSLVIEGAGPADIVVDTAADLRMFDVHDGVVVLRTFSAANGNSLGGYAPYGLQVRSGATVTVEEVVFRDFPGTVNQTVIGSSGNLTMRASTITNSTTSNGTLTVSAGTTVLDGCTIDNNTSMFRAAGVWALGGTLRVVNSTISYNLCNTAASGEGGCAILVDGATVELINSTVASNVSQLGTTGGIYCNGNNATLINTVVAGNSDAAGNPDCFGPATSLGHNLIGLDGPDCGLVATGGDLFGSGASPASPNLLSLADNGGATRTQLPQSGSPLIDAGDDAACPPYDQRGMSRPQRTHCDIGSVEVP